MKPKSFKEWAKDHSERVPGEDLRAPDFLYDYWPGSCSDGKPCPNPRSYKQLREHLDKNHAGAIPGLVHAGAAIAWLEYQKYLVETIEEADSFDEVLMRDEP
jgi:hypothetical protein